MNRVLGLDGAGKAGWVGVIVDDDGFVDANAGPLRSVIEWAEPVAAIGIDIPLGETPPSGRQAERAARAFVGPRRSSVFMPPPAMVLEGAPNGSPTYEAANRQLAASGHPKVSRQAWALRALIVEAALIANDDPRMIEVHPEVSFRAMHGEPLQWSKKTWNGLQLRLQLLHGRGIELPGLLETAGRAQTDDVVDAAAVAWSAHRHATGRSQALPATTTETDRHGRRLAIWY